MKNIYQKFFLTFLLFSISIITAQAASGDLDTTFGTDGKITVDFDGNPDPAGRDQDTGLDVAIQTDGKIIIVGESFIATTDSAFSATRLNPDGSLDTAFAANGKFLYNAAVGIAERAYAVAIQPDGKIVIAGRTNSPRKRIVIRLNSDGSLDTSFGTDGVFETPIGNPNFDEPEIAIQPDGKIIVVGAMRNSSATNDSFNIIRLNPDGRIDDTFGTGGQIETVFQQHDRAYGVLLLTDGKFLVTGGANNNGGFALARYNADGTLDNTFGTDGKVMTTFQGRTGLAHDVISLPDGKIIAAGYSRMFHSDAILIRYNADGSVDTTFGSDGMATFGNTNNEIFYDVYYKEGKIIGTGNRTLGAGAGSPDDFMIVRFDNNGTIDTGFGTMGAVYTDFNTTRELSLASAFQEDGKLVLAGWTSGAAVFNPDFAVARYDLSAVPGNTFADFDGDGRTDISVFRTLENGTSEWWLKKSLTNSLETVNWGIAGDIPTPADFDGDGKTDLAVWRPAPALEAKFIILNSSDNTLREEFFGQTGDNPAIVGDYDGDGKADPAVYRAGTESQFFYRGSSGNPNGNINYISWGTNGDRPVAGDYNGDGKMDFAVFRNGDWWILDNDASSYQVRQWGIAADKTVAADFDGDGTTDLAVFRPAEGIWYINNSSDNSITYQNWGVETDIPMAGDFDGDGKADVSVYRDGIWYILESSNGSMRYENFGTSTDIPIPSLN